MEIDLREGGKFSCCDRMITGQTIEIVSGERLVQVWRMGNWKPGEYSIVRFEFLKRSETEAQVVFDHIGFPNEYCEHLEQGWPNKYWEPIKAYLNA